MQRGMNIVDIGFGTGFPLLELSQRFGSDSKIIGIDIWNAAIERTKEKIKILEIENIELHTQSANNIKIADHKIDLVTSNLGVNNFADKNIVYAEIYRILKKNGTLAITTNPVGTFKELFKLFEHTIQEYGLPEEIENLKAYIAKRGTEAQIISEIEKYKLKLVKRKSAKTNMRFVNAQSLLNHSLVRIGFRDGWDQLIRTEKRSAFYQSLCTKLDHEIKKKGVFKISIPMLYLEFKK